MAAVEKITEGVNNLSVVDSAKKNRIQVSNTKKPLFFYVNLAKRICSNTKRLSFLLWEWMHADKLNTQIELTFTQMNTAGTKLDCFLALQRQEKLAASFRIKGFWEEVQKQKEVEKTLQKRYGDCVAELERIQQPLIGNLHLET